MTGQRVRIGHEVRVVGERPNGVELEGTARLSPGSSIEMILAPAGEKGAPTTRRATVCSWNVVRVGSGGPVFRGLCTWS